MIGSILGGFAFGSCFVLTFLVGRLSAKVKALQDDLEQLSRDFVDHDFTYH